MSRNGKDVFSARTLTPGLNEDRSGRRRELFLLGLGGRFDRNFLDLRKCMLSGCRLMSLAAQPGQCSPGSTTIDGDERGFELCYETSEPTQIASSGNAR